MSYDYLFKYILVGNSGCGKTCLLLQFIDKRFEPTHDLTIGVEFGARMVSAQGDRKVKIQAWDCAGSESFRSITRSYYRQSTVALLVYDITRRETFNALESWLREIRDQGSYRTTIVLVGNKIDKEAHRVVSTDEGRILAKEHGLMFIETSARTAFHVDDAFLQPLESVLCRIDEHSITTSDFDRLGIRKGITFPKTKNDLKDSRRCC